MAVAARTTLTEQVQAAVAEVLAAQTAVLEDDVTVQTVRLEVRIDRNRRRIRRVVVELGHEYDLPHDS